MAAAVYDQILLTGDSLTERGWDHPGGFAHLLAGEIIMSVPTKFQRSVLIVSIAAAYNRCFDVINRGLGAYRSTVLMISAC